MEVIYFYSMLFFNAVGFSWILSVLTKKQKVNDDVIVEKLLKTLDKEVPVDVLGLFNPLVWEMYLEYLKNPESLRTSGLCTITNGKVEIWSANDLHNRRFHTHDKRQDLEELNKSLTHYDQLLMDKLCRCVIGREKMIGFKITF